MAGRKQPVPELEIGNGRREKLVGKRTVALKPRRLKSKEETRRKQAKMRPKDAAICSGSRVSSYRAAMYFFLVELGCRPCLTQGDGSPELATKAAPATPVAAPNRDEETALKRTVAVGENPRKFLAAGESLFSRRGNGG